MNFQQGLFSTEYYDKLQPHMLKNKIIEIQNFPNLIKFLSEDSILLDEETINSLEIDFLQEINIALAEYSSVFVKLNFSAATDTEFLVHEAKCLNLKDILTVLKGSTRINENFGVFMENKQKENNKLCLILKPWYKIDNRDEFRIFLINSELKGICQRYPNFYFDYSQEELNDIKENIITFYQYHLSNLSEQENLIVDLLFLKKSKKLKIIDIISERELKVIKKQREQNLSETSDFLLFYSWTTLQNLNSYKSCYEDVAFKVINSPNEVFDTQENLNRFPIEITGEDKDLNVAKIIDLLRENNG